VIQEVLRINPIAPATSPSHFEKDVKVGNLHIKAHQSFMINHSQLHLSALYWKDPECFNPNRFDDSHPDSRCPDGSKRPQFCWMPFSGGKRVCFGKTFAEAILRILGTMFAETFDMELVNSDKYDSNNLPKLMGGQSHFPKNPLRLTKRA